MLTRSTRTLIRPSLARVSKTLNLSSDASGQPQNKSAEEAPKVIISLKIIYLVVFLSKNSF